MAKHRVEYTSGATEDIEATFYKDEKTFIDFYAESEDGMSSDRVLRIQAGKVRRVELLPS